MLSCRRITHVGDTSQWEVRVLTGIQEIRCEASRVVHAIVYGDLGCTQTSHPSHLDDNSHTSEGSLLMSDWLLRLPVRLRMIRGTHLQFRASSIIARSRTGM